MRYFLTIDIGASSGRIIASSLNDNQIKMTEVKRFKHQMIEKNDMLYLNFEYLMKQIYLGIEKAFNKYQTIEAIGIDTWGVDYGLLDENLELLRDVVNYRSNRKYHLVEKYHQKVTPKELYEKTGIQPLSFNTIYQVLDDIEQGLLEKAKYIVLLPDLIAFYLTGNIRTEITNLSTTSLYDQNKQEIIKTLLDDDIKDKFGKLIFPTEKYGTIKEELCKKYHLKPVDVIAVCSHDTASAVLPVLDKDSTIYISSGTWSLLGTHLEKPILTPEAMNQGFTNEIGYQGQIRFLKNIMGMWMITKVLETWPKKHKSLIEIIETLDKIKTENVYIDLNDKRFMKPKNMTEELKAYFSEKSFRFPDKIEELLSIIFTNMAFTYRSNIESLERITKKRFYKISIVGGGSKNRFLNQLTANITGKKVICGHPESTALGNLIVLLIAKQVIKSEDEIHQLLEKNGYLQTYVPYEKEKWDKLFKEYNKSLKKGEL